LKIQNPFRLGLFGGLGVLVAVLIGQAVGNLATILTYVGAALFLALGIDPLVSWLQRKGVARPLAILIVLVGVLAVFAGLVLAIIPVVIDQVNRLIEVIPSIVATFEDNQLVQDWWEDTIPWIAYEDALANVQQFIADNIGLITGGVLNTVVSIATGAFGGIIVLILTLYFVASLSSIKRALYQLVPATKRETFIGLAEQIGEAVGRYVVGQGVMGLTNGVLSFIVLNVIGWIIGNPIEYSALLAFIAFLFSLIPLVGTITGSVVITAFVWLFDGFPAVLIVGIWYLVYMQLEAYLLSPTVMNRAVKVPGAVVVIAALAGGTLLGLLGALIAIPVAAAIMLIFKQVVIPRQNAL